MKAWLQKIGLMRANKNAPHTRLFWATSYITLTLLFTALAWVSHTQLGLYFQRSSIEFSEQTNTIPPCLNHYQTTQEFLMHAFLALMYIFLTLALTGFRREEELKIKNQTIAAQVKQKELFEDRMKSHIQDVQKAHERAMRAIDDAEKANMAKSEFLASMSHELRTPMNGILGMAGMLEGTDMNNEQSEYVTIIMRSATSLLAILNDILDLSKIEAGGIEMETTHFSLRKCLIDTIELFLPLATDKNINLEIEMGRTLPRAVEGDEGRIIQILRNLLGNAIKFTEKGTVRLHAVRDDRGVLFSIADTGIGIPADQRARIFDKFTQADNTRTRKFGGTGLGLAICKQLVEMMHGEIGVDSEPGVGSTFWFRLPLEECEIDDEDVDAYVIGERNFSSIKEDKLNHHAKILLAEDHPTNQFLVKRILNKHGFVNIDIVENGREAVEAYNIGNYDLILMDGMMPEMDGYEATRTIRESVRDRRRRTPIIAMTANAMVGDREKCLEAGMDDYISKPVDAQKFIKLLAKWAPLQDPEASGFAKPAPATPTPAETRDQGPVNIPHLESFTEGDKDVEKELFDIFIDQMGLGISSLETFIGPEKQADWKSAAHRIKGAAANLGAEKLAALCLEAETGFEKTEATKRDILIEITKEAEIVHNFIEARLK